MVDSLCVVVEENLREISLAFGDILPLNPRVQFPTGEVSDILEVEGEVSTDLELASLGVAELKMPEDIGALLRFYSVGDANSYSVEAYSAGESESTEYLPYVVGEVPKTPLIFEEVEAKVEKGVLQDIYAKKMNSSFGQSHVRRFNSFNEQNAAEWYCFVNRFWIMLLYDITG